MYTSAAMDADFLASEALTARVNPVWAAIETTTDGVCEILPAVRCGLCPPRTARVNPVWAAVETTQDGVREILRAAACLLL